VSSADVVVAVKGGSDDVEPLIIERTVDPNISHPLRQKEVIEKVGPEVAGIRFTSYTFQAIVWKYDIKNTPHMCWRSSRGELIKYSSEIPSFLKRLTKNEIEVAIRDYKARYIR
jgi:hypothetical protein